MMAQATIREFVLRIIVCCDINIVDSKSIAGFNYSDRMLTRLSAIKRLAIIYELTVVLIRYGSPNNEKT